MRFKIGDKVTSNRNNVYKRVGEFQTCQNNFDWEYPNLPKINKVYTVVEVSDSGGSIRLKDLFGAFMIQRFELYKPSNYELKEGGNI